MAWSVEDLHLEGTQGHHIPLPPELHKLREVLWELYSPAAELDTALLCRHNSLHLPLANVLPFRLRNIAE